MHSASYLLVLVLGLGLCARPALAKPRVILISIDAMRAGYLNRAIDQGDIAVPNLVSLIKSGTWAVNGSVPAFPAQTFPSHTSMITGLLPAKHGIYINDLLDVQNNNQDQHYFYMDITGKTIIDAANERNLTTAGVDWPVTVGAPYTYLFPGNVDQPNGLDEAKWLFNTCKGPVHDILLTPEAMRHVTDHQRGDLAALFYKDLLPDLITLHYNDLDDFSHATGYMTPTDIAQLEYIDVSIGTLIAAVQATGTFDTTTWIVTSDHGFSNLTGQLSPGVILAKHNLTVPQGKLDYVAYMMGSGGCSAIMVHPNATTEQRVLVDKAIQEIVTTAAGRIPKVWTHPELVAVGAFPDAYVVLESSLDVTFTDDLTGDFFAPRGGGGHGWSPYHPEMMASFVATGPGIRKNAQIDTTRLIDIGPTVAHILGLDLPNIDGRVLWEIFSLEHDHYPVGFTTRIEEAQLSADIFPRNVRERMQTTADGKRRPAPLYTTSVSWCSFRAATWPQTRPSNKLDYVYVGPYPLLERTGEVDYRLKLPQGDKTHNVFHVNLLKPFVENTIPDRTDILPNRIRVGDELEWEVERILRNTEWSQTILCSLKSIQGNSQHSLAPCGEPHELLQGFSSLRSVTSRRPSDSTTFCTALEAQALSYSTAPSRRSRRFRPPVDGD